MADANELRKGVTFLIDNELFRVIDYHHHKPGRGLATIRIKAVNLRTGSIIEKTFSSGEKVDTVRLDYHQAQYLYNDGQNYYFMDTETYEQPSISAAVVSDAANYLTEEMQVKLTVYQGVVLDIELPTAVEMKVIQADPAVKGDTATGVNKKIITETGLAVSVPAFVEIDNIIKVDTRTGEYITRV